MLPRDFLALSGRRDLAAVAVGHMIEPLGTEPRWQMTVLASVRLLRLVRTIATLRQQWKRRAPTTPIPTGPILSGDCRRRIQPLP